jgi:hypothetical protein
MNHLPLIDTPPFHRPIAPGEIKMILKRGAPKSPPAHVFDIGEGWVLSFVSTMTVEGRFPRWGWVKGRFAICPDQCETFFVAKLYLLPDGARLAFFETAGDAVAGAYLISQAIDWSDPSRAALNAQQDRLLAAMLLTFDDIGPGDARIWRLKDTRQTARAHG